jgi:hypothetical protein
VAKLIDGLSLTEPREIELFRQCTGRTQLLTRHERRALRRFLLLVGRRGGKDRFLSAVAVWRAALCTDWRRHISVGEQAVVLLLGRDKKQANILRRYCHGLLQVEAIKREVVRETKDVIEFRGGGTLEIISNHASLCRADRRPRYLAQRLHFGNTTKLQQATTRKLLVLPNHRWR